jgi:hypothetical protein
VLYKCRPVSLVLDVKKFAALRSARMLGYPLGLFLYYFIAITATAVPSGSSRKQTGESKCDD